MSLMVSLVTTSRKQQCFYVLIDIYHEFLLLSYSCVLLEIKFTTTKYLGMFINYDIWWNFYVLTSLSNYILPYIFITKIASNQSSFTGVHRSFKLHNLYGSSTQVHINLIQRAQIHATRLIIGNFDYINSRGMGLVNCLNLYTAMLVHACMCICACTHAICMFVCIRETRD